MAAIAAPVLMLGAAGAAADPVHVLVTLGRVLGEVDPGPGEHKVQDLTT